MKGRGAGAPPLSILAGETYLDLEAGRHVVVVEAVLDRSGSSPRRTDRFRVVAADGPERGRMWVARTSALSSCTGTPSPIRSRGGPARTIASVLASALSRIGAAALPHCETEDERAIARALAECAVSSAHPLHVLERLLTHPSAKRRDERKSS